MRFTIATWNMDHWKGVNPTPDHNARAWAYVASLGADVVLLQEAAPPPESFDATVLPLPSDAPRWRSGDHAAFGTAIAVRGHAASEVDVAPLGTADQTKQVAQSHRAAFTAARVMLDDNAAIVVVSPYGALEQLVDGETYSTTSVHRSLSDLTPLLYST